MTTDNTFKAIYDAIKTLNEIRKTVQEVKECMSVLDDMTTFMILLIILKIDLVINKYRT